MNKEAVQKIIADHVVTIFSKTYCPFCTKAKNLFKELGVSAHILELDTMGEGSKIQALLQEISGQRTVPNVYINGEHIGGCDDTMGLYKNGQLVKKLEAAGVSVNK
ncbi:Glutaredoxin domain-containing protein [Balamuthia mandrillaris]